MMVLKRMQCLEKTCKRAARRQAGVQCPVCMREGNSMKTIETDPGYTWMRCESCGVQFCDPMPVSTTGLYSLSYSGVQNSLDGQIRYSPGVALGQLLVRLPDVRPFLTGVERQCVNWLVDNLRPGSAVLDVGCGIGRFLIAANHAGFDAYGIDVASKPIKTLQESHYKVANGCLDNVPKEWPEPAVVTALEVLEHVAAPVKFLKEVRRCFSKSQVLIAVPAGFSRSRCDAAFRTADEPPNHLTRWSTRSLHCALVNAGYSASVYPVHVGPNELSPVTVSAACLERHVYRVVYRVCRRMNKSMRVVRQESGAQIDHAEVLDELREERIRRNLRSVMQFPKLCWLYLRGASTYWLLAVGCPSA